MDDINEIEELEAYIKRLEQSNVHLTTYLKHMNSAFIEYHKQVQVAEAQFMKIFYGHGYDH